MWIFVSLLNLVGPRKSLRLAALWLLIMSFFAYCLVHDGSNCQFQMVVPQTVHRPTNTTAAASPSGR